MFTKKIRRRKTNTPYSIELPPQKFGDFFLPSTPAGHGAPATPTTPSCEKFVSIAFEDQPTSHFPSPSQRLRSASARSSRSGSVASASVASNKEFSVLAFTASPTQSLNTPEIEMPTSPRSISEEPDKSVDEMALHILDRAKKGNQKWYL